MSTQEQATLGPQHIDGGRYEVREIITAAPGTEQKLAMLAVHAEDSETGRSVFMKLRNSADDDFAAERIRREAEVLAHLSHARIPRLFAADPDAETPYIVTQLMPGEQLAQRQGDERYPAKLAAALGIAVLEVLEYVHDQGVIHRDIKPSNLLYTDGNVVSVVDFDIAQLQNQAAAQRVCGDDRPYHPLKVEAELSGITAGTPEYMSPEQTKGRYVTPASDIYSMGAMLYRMTTGKLLRGESATMPVQRVTSNAKTQGAFSTLEVPQELDTVIARATQQDPDARYESAGEMREALEASVYSKEDGHQGGFALWFDRLYGDRVKPVFKAYATRFSRDSG